MGTSVQVCQSCGRWLAGLRCLCLRMGPVVEGGRLATVQDVCRAASDRAVHVPCHAAHPTPCSALPLHPQVHAHPADGAGQCLLVFSAFTTNLNKLSTPLLCTPPHTQVHAHPAHGAGELLHWSIELHDKPQNVLYTPAVLLLPPPHTHTHPAGTCPSCPWCW
jgi:hypothetical protein